MKLMNVLLVLLFIVSVVAIVTFTKEYIIVWIIADIICGLLFFWFWPYKWHR